MAIVGPNGIGKSTFINLLLGRVEPVNYQCKIEIVNLTFPPSTVIWRNKEEPQTSKLQ